MSGEGHAPKTAALVAYLEGVLTPEGARRLESHLAGCGTCARALGAMRAYDALVDEARAIEPPAARSDAAAWEALRARLPRRRLGLDGRVAAWAVGAAGVAAAVAFLALAGAPGRAPRSGADPVGDRFTVPERPAPALPAPADVEVTAWSGEVRVDGEPLADHGPRLAEGDRLTTGPGAALHAAIATADGGDNWAAGPTGWALGPDADVALASARVGELILTVERGALTVAAGALGDDAYVGVRAGRYTVSVEGTRFLVSREREDGEVRVVVAEGVVRIHDPGRASPIRVGPGEVWSSRAGRIPRPIAAPEVEALATPWLPEGVPGDGTAAFTLPQTRGVVSWELGGAHFDAAGDVRVRLAPARFEPEGIELAALDRFGRRRLERVPLAGDPLPTAAFEPRAPAEGRGVLTVEQIRPVVRRGQRGLRRCYERWARSTGREAPIELRLRLKVGRRGDVVDATVVGDGVPVPPPLGGCVAQAARGWLFPLPEGGPVRLEVPVRFGPGSRR